MAISSTLNDTNLVARDLKRTPPFETDGLIPRAKLSYKEFYKDYLKANKPVLIEGAIDDWPALKKWSPLYFKKNFPNKKLLLRDLNSHTKLADFVDMAESATADYPAPYLRNIHIREDFPELLEDINENLIFGKPDFLNSRLLPQNWIRPQHQIELFYGGIGTKIFTLHYDVYLLHNLIIGIAGEKEFILIPPEDTKYLYPKDDNEKHSPINVFEPDLERYPDYVKASPLKGTLGPGDTAFVPAGWWHMTRIKTPSISVGMCSVNATNWSYFVKDVRPRPENGNLLKWLLVRTYLGTVGFVFRFQQWFFNNFQSK